MFDARATHTLCGCLSMLSSDQLLHHGETFDFSAFHFISFRAQIVSICSMSMCRTVINCELYRCAMCGIMMIRVRGALGQAFAFHHEIFIHECVGRNALMCMICWVHIKSAIENWQLILWLLLCILSKYIFASIQCDVVGVGVGVATWYAQVFNLEFQVRSVWSVWLSVSRLSKPWKLNEVKYEPKCRRRKKSHREYKHYCYLPHQALTPTFFCCCRE